MKYPMNIPTGLISSDVYFEPSDIGDQASMLTAFRHAANSIGVEAGVVASHVHPSEIEASVIGDTYYLELISEAELRLKKLSIRYERLRAAAIPVVHIYDEDSGIAPDMQCMRSLKEALTDDH